MKGRAPEQMLVVRERNVWSVHFPSNVKIKDDDQLNEGSLS